MLILSTLWQKPEITHNGRLSERPITHVYDGLDCTAYFQSFKSIVQFKLKLQSNRIPLSQKILAVLQLILPILHTIYFPKIAFIHITRMTCCSQL
jgi:hypothetical protein